MLDTVCSRGAHGLSIALISIVVTCPPGSARGFDWIAPIERLAEGLRSKNSSARLRAVRGLAALESDDIEPLVLRALSDPEPRVALAAARIAAEREFSAARETLTRWLLRPETELRLAASRGLARLGTPESVLPLARVLGDPEARVRLAAVETLGALASARAVAPLLRRIDDPSSDVRAAVLRALAQLARPHSVPQVAGRLADPVPAIRAAAARALGRLGDARAAPGLVTLLQDSNDEVVVAAAEAVGRLRHAPATDALGDLLRGGAKEPRAAAAKALARIGTPTSVRTLVRALSSDQLRALARRELVAAPPAMVADTLGELLQNAHTNRPTLQAAVALAAELQLRSLLPLLVDLLERERLPVRLLTSALGRLGDPAAQRALLVLTDSRDPETRLAAVAALPQVVDERARDIVRRLLDDPYRPVRLAAAALVGQLRDPEAVRLLDGLCASADLGVARAATRALAQIGQPHALPVFMRQLQHYDGEIRRIAVEALLNAGSALEVGRLILTCRGLSGGPRADCLQVFAAVLRAGRTEPALSFLRNELEREDDAVRAATLSVISVRQDKPAADLLVRAIPQLPLPLRARALATLARFSAVQLNQTSLLREGLEDPNSEIQAAAAWAVGGLRLRSLAPSLRRLVYAAPWAARVNAVAALARLANTNDCGLFRLLLGDRDPHVRANAAMGLGRCPIAALSTRQLRRRLADEPSPWVRLNLLRTLGRRRAADTAQTLAQRDPDPRVRAAAQQLDANQRHEGERWIGFYLQDLEGQPLRHDSVALIVPSGLVKATRTDARAQLWEQNLPPGRCHVERPSPQLPR